MFLFFFHFHIMFKFIYLFGQIFNLSKFMEKTIIMHGLSSFFVPFLSLTLLKRLLLKVKHRIAYKRMYKI